MPSPWKTSPSQGRILTGDQNIPAEDVLEWHTLNAEYHVAMNPQRNGGMRITGPWIFGMVECHKQADGSYKSGEVRLFKVERRTSAILLPIIRQHVAPGTVFGVTSGRLIQELGKMQMVWFMNHGVHTQNIERAWSSLKQKIVRNIRGNSASLFQSYLEEFTYRTRATELDRWQLFVHFLEDATRSYPITW
ncbi:hypothetical protein RF11_02611 [Thelohanellus kitauei]|uniref:ISXO2-like transposase domain-containing protein n=1 Tax=Thelohanellus kitauei TaxID=669202 RepID=A0A0C2J555_THEKT|nr:hypothetical protein RF11_02611 [Thelohanellus kitauei]